MEEGNHGHVTADELLAGANATFSVEVPQEIMRPGGEANGKPVKVQLRPITIGSFQLILRAAKDDAAMIPLLLIKEAMAEPPMTMAQIQRMHIGLVEHLVTHIKRISGLGEKKKT